MKTEKAIFWASIFLVIVLGAYLLFFKKEGKTAKKAKRAKNNKKKNKNKNSKHTTSKQSKSKQSKSKSKQSKEISQGGKKIITKGSIPWHKFLGRKKHGDDSDDEHVGDHIHFVEEEKDVESRKIALQFGLLYKGTEYALKGCVNDLENVREGFLKPYGFDEKHIVTITDDAKVKPTFKNMRLLMKKFIAKSMPGDHMVLQYSGHGTEVKDRDGDEADGMDEAICPLDYLKADVIVDDWIFANVVKPLEKQPHTSLLVLMDCCHSGTSLDLQYHYFATRDSPASVRLSVSKAKKRHTDANVIAFAAALDNQTAADIQTEGLIPQGAFTECFLKVVARHLKVKRTYRNFLLELDSELAKGGFHHQASLNSTRSIDLDEKCLFWIH